MSTNKTTHYQLNQWEAEDKVLRTEFNEDNMKIDGALAALAGAVPRIVTGTYIGDGQDNQTIQLGFTPRAVYSCISWGSTYTSAGWFYFGGLAFPEVPASTSDNYLILSVVDGGFQVYYQNSGQNIRSNTKGEHYHYIALA